jgi:hypothetical protein
MHFTEEIRQLRADNGRLEAQIRDLEFLIQAREEELNLLRIKVDEVSRLRSSLESRIYEIDQLQQLLKEESQKALAADIQGEILENELLQAIKAETQNEELKEQSSSLQTENEYLQQELKDSLGFYKEVADLKRKVSLLGSRLELAELATMPTRFPNSFGESGEEKQMP